MNPTCAAVEAKAFVLFHAPNEGEMLLSAESMTGFFSRELDQASSQWAINLGAFTKSYIVSVLTEHAHVELCEPSDHSETLAMLYLESVRAASDERYRLLKRLGDLALCTAGFFSERFERKIVDVNYYIQMGSGAYASLARALSHRHEAAAFSDLYQDLAENFALIVDLIGTISDKTKGQAQSTIRLYERWLKTHSVHLEKQLIKRGISVKNPVKSAI